MIDKSTVPTAIPLGNLYCESIRAIEKTCLDASKNGIVAPANYDSPGQIVIAGEKHAAEAAMALAKTAGAKRVVPLPVSAPSHCSMMKDAGERLAKEPEGVALRGHRFPIVSNAGAKVLNVEDRKSMGETLAALGMQ